MSKKPQVALIVLDGWGHREEKEYNAIAEAKTPFFDFLWKNYPHTTLKASGESVGLPEGQMGNSEVGHTIIGAGKVIYTDLVKITKSIKENTFSANTALCKLFTHVKKHDSTLHIQGLIGPGGVHSHSEHLYALIKAAKNTGIEKLVIHAFTDGRDTAPTSASKYLKELEEVIEETGIGFIATASGRFYAMDRDSNWDRIKRVEDALFEGKAVKKLKSKNPSKVLEELYKEGIVDEHLEPIIFLDDNGKHFRIQKNDGVFYFNFRVDRARALTTKILEKKQTLNLCLVTMTEYDKNHDCFVAFPPETIETTLAKEISENGLSQVHIAETEKFAHATYYLNGGVTEPQNKEKHILIDSRKDIDTHDKAPEMRAKKIADEALKHIAGTDFIFINFANPDMVGHTANRKALIRAIEAVDKELKRVVAKLIQEDAVAIITADHGNAEVYFDKKENTKHTAHTTNNVPFVLTKKSAKLKSGSLCDIAPTILELLKLKKPKTMTGATIIKNLKFDSNRKRAK